MYNGVIIVNKEPGFTSHDVVAKLRGIFRQKKIGHTGTLDPDATGVLPVCLGHATKLCDMLTDKDKTYEAVMLLGQVTDTQDISGKILETSDVESLRNEGSLGDSEIMEAILSFVGEYNQIPPMYSALKVNGKKLYELAREGIEIEREPRKVYIHAVENICIDFPKVTMTVTCSKGTYIRTLCHDIGKKLGCGACMDSLKRTKVSMFDLNEALTLSQISDMVQAGEDINSHIISVETIFAQYPAVYTREEYDRLIYNGNSLKKEMVTTFGKTPHKDSEQNEPVNDKVRVYDSKGVFMGIFAYSSKDMQYKCEKMFYTP